ncbi:hypothetical protein BDV95DRAFT_596127 [Massariosphaeria phaeospora]|uniref:Uncharacterized protein n=1 Tax=Massariosphaeria phaeospora TaxID=100035 RepID=A0A7C8MCH8_9PLEO|nr:hypothetical protein BDV95DRAFT_596127 [Massariosphaeria phaeospora]
MPPPEFWDEEDEWYTDRYQSGARHVRPPPRKASPPRRARDDAFSSLGRRTTEFLAPEHHFTTGLHRSRSQGHGPAPAINIYNTTSMDNESSPNVRTEQRSPAPSPRMSPRGRPRRLADEYSLEDEIAELRLQVQRQTQSRSQSRYRDESPHHHHHTGHPYPPAHPNHEREKWELQTANEREKWGLQAANEREKWELQAANDRLKEAEDRLEQERREEFIRKKIELKHMKEKQEHDEEEARAKAEEDRFKKDFELKIEREERKRIERVNQAKAEEDRIKKDIELKVEREERKRMERAKEAEEEKRRIIAENTLKNERAEREAKEARQRAVDEFNRRKAEEDRKAKEERDRVIADYERRKVEDAVKAKQQREHLLMQLKIEEEKQKQKDKEEWERFVQKQKAKEEAEKAKKDKEDAELEEAMRKRLAQFGFQENQIQAMVNPEEAKKLQQGMTPLNPMRLTHQPTYVKVHKDHLATDTLLYYDIPYEFDSTDPNYLIILREMDQKETEILFEHTRRLRRTSGSSRLLIEERRDHGKTDYAWVRRKSQSKSPSRRRSSPPKRVVGLKEMFY